MTNPVDFPVCLRLLDVPVLVVGGGAVAQQRCEALLAVGARITLVAPQVTWALGRLAQDGKLAWQPQAFEPRHLTGQRVAFTATDDMAVSREVAEHAARHNILVNAADIPALCDFTLPSTGRRGPITVAVSTGGLAPALAAQLQRTFTGQVRTSHVQWARVQGFLRRRLPAGPARMTLIKQWVTGPVGELFLSGQRREALALLRASLRTVAS